MDEKNNQLNQKNQKQKENTKTRLSRKRLRFDKKTQKYYILDNGKKIFVETNRKDIYVKIKIQKQPKAEKQRKAFQRFRYRNPYSRMGTKAIVLEQQLKKAEQELLASKEKIDNLQKKLLVEIGDKKIIEKIHKENVHNEDLQRKVDQLYRNMGLHKFLSQQTQSPLENQLLEYQKQQDIEQKETEETENILRKLEQTRGQLFQVREDRNKIARDIIHGQQNKLKEIDDSFRDRITKKEKEIKESEDVINEIENTEPKKRTATQKLTLQKARENVREYTNEKFGMLKERDEQIEKLLKKSKKEYENVSKDIDKREKDILELQKGDFETLQKKLSERNPRTQEFFKKASELVEMQKQREKQLQPDITEEEKPGFYNLLSKKYYEQMTDTQELMKRQHKLEKEDNPENALEIQQIKQMLEPLEPGQKEEDYEKGIKKYKKDIKKNIQEEYQKNREEFKKVSADLKDKKKKLSERYEHQKKILKETQNDQQKLDLQAELSQMDKLKKDVEQNIQEREEQLKQANEAEQEEIRKGQEFLMHSGYGKSKIQKKLQGLELEKLISLILINLDDKAKDYDIIVITNDKEKIQSGKDNQIVIFLKDHHYTTMVHEKKRQEFVYYNPYGSVKEQDIKRRERDEKQIKDFAQRIYPEHEVKYKFNINPVQKDDSSKGFDDSDKCGYLVFLFINDYVTNEMKFKQASHWKNLDKQEMEKLIPYSFSNKFPFI